MAVSGIFSGFARKLQGPRKANPPRILGRNSPEPLSQPSARGVSQKKIQFQPSFSYLLTWAIPPVRLGLSGRKFRKHPGPETLSELFLEFPSRVRLGCPKPYNSRHLKAPERFQNCLPASRAGDASFFTKVVLETASQSRWWNNPAVSEGISDY